MQHDFVGKPVWIAGAAAGQQLAAMLDEVGLETRAFDGVQALLEALEQRTPALLMADAAVFDEPGALEHFVERVRGARQAAFPVFVVTEQMEPQSRRRLLEAGVDDWVAKPLVTAQLRARVLGQLALHGGQLGGEQPPAHQHQASVTRLDSPLSVLVCDDKPMIHRVLRSAFERRGWFVSEARDGREALELLDEHSFDLAVFDLSLPYTNGFELLEVFAHMPAQTCPRTIVLSAEKQQDSVLRAFELGADDFVHKPVNPEILVARVQRLMRPPFRGRPDG